MEKNKRKDYFVGRTKDVVGNIITHRSFRKMKRGHIRREQQKYLESTSLIQNETDKEGNPKKIYHDKYLFRKRFRKQVDRAHRKQD